MPPSGNGVALLLGDEYDTGYSIDPSSWTVLGIPTGGSQYIGIRVSAAVNIQIIWS